MDNRECNDIFFETLAKILITSFLLGLAFLLIWFLLYLIGTNWMYEINAKWFDIGKRDFHLINYCGMGFVKLSILVVFFFPYLSLRLVLRKRKGSIGESSR
jgi:hypothetical protein